MTHTTDTGAQEARIKLKPCKSCGGAPEVTYYGRYFGEWDNDLELTDDMLDDIDDIHCAECGLWTGDDMTLREAIKWWNNQPLIEDLQAIIATQAARIEEMQRAHLVADDTLTGDLEQAQARIAQLETALAEAGQWETVGLGERVMCDCKDPQCYHAIEAIESDLLVYEDISDITQPAIVVRLPANWRLQRRVQQEANHAE